MCVIQVALEGSISKKSAVTSLAQGSLPQGDLIPWTIGQQFQVFTTSCCSSLLPPLKR
jgi:N-acetyltransferase 10